MANEVGQWLECHPGLAGWAQAAGAILAIFGAGAIANWQFRKQEKAKKADQVQQGRAVGLTVQVSFHQIEKTTDEAIETRSPWRLENALPDDVIGQLDRLWLMGDAGDQALTVIAELRLLGMEMAAFRAPNFARTQADTDEFLDRAMQRAAGIKVLCRLTNEKIAKLVGGTVH
jgi:hypothetical protein